MTIEAELHDGRVLEFPDGTAPEVVQATVKKMMAASQKRERFIPGDAGSLLSAGEAYDQIGKGFDWLGGKATDLLAGKVKPEVAGAIGTGISVGLPAAIGGGIGRLGADAVKREGKDLMISALRPTKLQRVSGDAERAATTMIDEGKNVTRGGVTALREKVGTLNDELQTALNSSPATVDKSAIASRLQDVISKIETSTFTPQERVKAVEKIYNDVIGNTSIPNQIPVALANKIKSGIYKELGDLKYSRARTGAPISDAETAQMALARGAKEEISAAVPSAEPLNSRMGKLINAADMADNSVLASAANSPGGLAWLAHNIPAAVSMLVARHPASKSMIARALHGGAETMTTGAGATVGGTAGALASGSSSRSNVDRIIDELRNGR